MSILILAEHNNSEVKSSTLNTISAASQIDQPPQVHRSEEMRWQTYSRRTPCVCRQNPPRPPDRRSSLSVAS